MFTQEGYSVARQFNLIPPVCEQAEYHFFQRDKVETQLPELYHKIGKSVFFPPTLLLCFFVFHAVAHLSMFPPRRGRGLLVPISLWNHHREVRERCPRILQGLNEGAEIIVHFYYKKVCKYKINRHCDTILSSPPSAISVVERKDNERRWKEAAGQAKGTGSHSREAGLYFTTVSYR